MLNFWLAASVLIALAVTALLLPLLRRPSSSKQPEASREAANLALYQERLAELQAQSLLPKQLAEAQSEAARALLADTPTPSAAAASSTHTGRALIFCSAALVPLLASLLYWHWGASRQLALTYELAQPPAHLADMLQRLERITELQPDAVQGWYMLGRAYMVTERPGEAAKAFEQAAKRSNRSAEVLGQWAQALYFANAKQWSAPIEALANEALKSDPKEITSLGLLGIAAFEQNRFAQAIHYWQQLALLLPENDPSRQAIEGGIARARSKLATEPDAAKPAFALTLHVELGAALEDKVAATDSLFVFIRAACENCPKMPLAVKRLQVADLPLQLTLTDKDAMLPELKPSAFDRLQVLARISKEGNPTKGQWLAQSKVIFSNNQEVQRLVIEKADNRD